MGRICRHDRDNIERCLLSNTNDTILPEVFYDSNNDDSDESDQYSSEEDDEEDSDVIPEASLRQHVERKHRKKNVSDATCSSSSNMSTSSNTSRSVFIFDILHIEKFTV